MVLSGPAELATGAWAAAAMKAATRKGAAPAHHEPIFTIGHSTRPIDDFMALLEGHGVTRLVDVRTVPKSRHNPQFEGPALAAALVARGIAYEHAARLGGFRRARPDTRNAGWRNASFRGYADYMQTGEFVEALDAVLHEAESERVALMCAEAVPWRCHRSLIADALTVRGAPTFEITSATKSRLHKLIPFAKVEGKTLVYPAEPATG